MPWKKPSFFGHLWSKMGSIQIEIKYLKSATRILILWLQKDMNQIFFEWGAIRLSMTICSKVRGCQSWMSKIIRTAWSLAAKIAMLKYGPGSIPGLGQLWRLVTLQSFSLRGFIVTHLKDIFHICLEPEEQDHSRTFKIIYALSNNPYFIS